MFQARTILAALAIGALIMPTALAQRPGGGPPMSPEVQARMKAWQKFRETHKNLTSLQQTMAGLEAMEKDPRTRLTKAQAKTVVGVLKTWRNKPVMTDAQALAVNKQITAPLSVAQLKKIATAREARGMGANRRPGGGQGGPAAGGGQGRPGANQTRTFDPSRFPAPREYNPLNPSTIPMERMREQAAKRLDTLTKALAARAG